MFDDVIERLAALGYTVDPVTDEWVLNFVIAKVTETIKNECNTDEMPEGLYYVAVDMVCGDFLFGKKSSGAELDIDAEAAVKRIKEGDTDITYAISDDSITLDGLIDKLRSGDPSQFAKYRRLTW
jgi:hypothetical protein